MKIPNKVIIDQTVERYSVPGSRAVRLDSTGNVLGCDYIDDTGRMCAVGVCAKNPLHLAGFGGNVESVWSEIEWKEGYEGRPLPFWQYLQHLHDGNEYWDLVNGGLSPVGKDYVAHLHRVWDDPCKAFTIWTE